MSNHTAPRTATLIVSELGAPDRTTHTPFATADLAREHLAASYDPSTIRERDEFSGTIGTMCGRVFQASKVYRIA